MFNKNFSVFILLLCLTGVCLDSVAAEVRKQESAPQTSLDFKSRTQEYEAILEELGAFPVSKLTKPYWNNGDPGKVYIKGTRLDVHGWLPPDLVRRHSYLTESEMQSYGIPKQPLSYERYVSFLDVESYQKTKDPLLFAIIKFTLEELRDRKLEIKNPDDVLQVYHAKIGLDHLALWTLHNRGLTGPMVADLYRQYQDDLLFRFLVPPKAGQDDYRLFLERLLTDTKIKPKQRFEVYTRLYQSDQQLYRAGYKVFLLGNVKQLSDWYDRSLMYEALMEIGDQRSVAAVNHALLNDPIAQTREFLLRKLSGQGKVMKHLSAIHLLALGKCAPFEIEFYPCGPAFQTAETVLDDSLRACLKQAQKQETLSKETELKIQQALQAIADREAQPEPVLGGGGDRFEANPRPAKK
ncbi:hypothetical protein Pan153_61610 [Gimesia panareensis]|uniref:Uncharacterized protein n=1 Tax=Gimesia panareensis TaxID=2527978 RepID=A0A518FYP2_9PLAN|nr:hypothetical protein [Gimesia panareensis]QDV21473.1 hypothetical protein Pan153_61610 [Gimesia panareensis]